MAGKPGAKLLNFFDYNKFFVTLQSGKVYD